MRCRGLDLVLIVAAGAVLVAPRSATAQIVNVQSLVAGHAPEGLSGSIDASIDWRTGNTDLLDLAGAIMLRYRSGGDLAIAVARGEIATALGERIVAKTFEHLRYLHQLSRLITGEIFVQHDADEFRRLALRALVGAGPRFQVLDDPDRELAFGLAYVLEHERLGSAGEPDDGEERTSHRLSSYLTGKLSLAGNLDVVATAYLQPRLDAPDDLRVLDETALVVHLTERTSIKTGFTLAYDTQPPAAVNALDTALKSVVAIML